MLYPYVKFDQINFRSFELGRRHDLIGTLTVILTFGKRALILDYDIPSYYCLPLMSGLITLASVVFLVTEKKDLTLDL